MKKVGKTFSYYIPFIIFLLPLLCGCELIKQYRLGDAVVIVNGQSLYVNDIDQLCLGLNTEDSTRIVNDYIKQWATQILEYDKAKSQIGNNKDIEDKVEAYRRALYIHEYEQWLVGEKMSKFIPTDSIEAIYEQYPDKFILKDNLLKGLFLVIHKDAPDQDKLTQWLANLNDENLELIEKYAYQYASAYQLFTDQWLTQSKVLLYIPTSQDDFNTQLRHHTLIQFQDSTSTYIVQVTEKQLAGERMPLDYATTDIERTILNLKQVEFINTEKEKIYNKAIEQNKLIFKQNNQDE